MDAAARTRAHTGRTPRPERSGRPSGPQRLSALAALVLASVVVTTAGLPLVALLARTVVSTRGGHRSGVDAIVVLGSTLGQDGRVPELLAARLDRAVTVYRAEAAQGRSPLVVASGGMASAALDSQASAMAAYLERHGVPAARLVLEDRSTTTRENLLCTAALLADRAPGAHELVVTSDYHVWRTTALARRSGLDVDVTGAPTPPGRLPRALLREYVLGVGVQGWGRVAVSAALVVACWPVLHPDPPRRRRAAARLAGRSGGAVLARAVTP